MSAVVRNPVDSLVSDFDWFLIPDRLIVYSGYKGEPPAQLISFRLGRTLKSLPEQLQGLTIAEVYTVDTNPGRDHGEHWHGFKAEFMIVERGSFEFELTHPSGRSETIPLSVNDKSILLIMPGIKHRVTALEPDSILRVHATTEHDDDNPDTFTDWPS